MGTPFTNLELVGLVAIAMTVGGFGGYTIAKVRNWYATHREFYDD